MENNLALKLFAALRKSAKGKPLTDDQVRKLTGLCQMDINIAAEELEAEGMIIVQRTYMLTEE
jgi:hypothetical protein